jgi:shikimate dehydrogenase
VILSNITGNTRILALIADPIAQALAPAMFNAEILFRQLQNNYVFIPLHVAPADLQSTLSTLRKIKNFDGAVISMPHKIAALAYVERVSPSAKMVGACNVVRRDPDGALSAALLDGHGFVKALHHLDFDPVGKSVLLHGVGGAGCSIAYSLCESNIASLTLSNRTQEKSETLIKRLRKEFKHIEFILKNSGCKSYQLVINASSIGMQNSPGTSIEIEKLDLPELVADIVINHVDTTLIKQAKNMGCKIINGENMLRSQKNELLKFMLND